VRLALLGLGGMGLHHLTIFAGLGAQIVAVADAAQDALTSGGAQVVHQIREDD
jgi:D-arabinose 1-dehydrogenase-like Zn-dependent alcohol dehydrogenase